MSLAMDTATGPVPRNELARKKALYQDSCELAAWLDSLNLSDRDRAETEGMIDSVKSGQLSLEAAMETMRERMDVENVEWRRRFRTSTADAKHDLSMEELNELETMGDWAKDQFDWDGTDVSLLGSGQTALDWLQKKGYISLAYNYTDLNEEQLDSLKTLRKKLNSEAMGMSAEAELAEVLRLLPWPSSDEQLYEEPTDIIYSEMPERNEEQERDEVDLSALDVSGFSPPRPSAEDGGSTVHIRRLLAAGSHGRPEVAAEDLVGVTRRLAAVWMQDSRAADANRLLSEEISELLLASRARLQAELVSLRRENEALRGQGPFPDAHQALFEEKRLTSTLQKLLNERDQRNRGLLRDLAQRNQELAVLRSRQKLRETHAAFMARDTDDAIALAASAAPLRPPSVQSQRSVEANIRRARLESIRKRMQERAVLANLSREGLRGSPTSMGQRDMTEL